MTSAPDPETIDQPSVTLAPATLSAAPSQRPARKTAAPTKQAAGAGARKAARPSPKATAKTTRKKAKPAKATPSGPGRDAARLLEGLHSSWRSALEAHRLRVEGQFRVVHGSLTAPKRRNAKEIERLREAVKVHLKPRKGRAKDLRRVEDALDKALSRLRGD